MFDKKYGTLAINEAVTKDGKKVLVGQRENGVKIIMDAFSNEGRMAYFFDNKIIITIGHMGYTPVDYENEFETHMILKFVPAPNNVSLFIRFGMGEWGYIESLPWLLSSFNNPEMAVDTVIIVFTDCERKKVRGTKVLRLNANVSTILRDASIRSYILFDDSRNKKSIYNSLEDLRNDWKRTLGTTNGIVESQRSFWANKAIEIMVDNEGYATYF